MINTKKFIKRVKTLQGDKSIRSFAELCCVSEGTIRRALSGDVSQKSIKTIARENKVSEEWLTGETEVGGPGIAKIQTDKQQNDYKEENEKEIFYKKASIHFEEFFDWIYEDIGTDAKSIRQGFKILEKGCPDFKQWRYAREKEELTKQSGTDN